MKKGILPVILLISLSCLTLAACGSQNAGSGGGGAGGAVINSNSLVTGEIKAIRQKSAGFPWEIDVLVLSTQDVDNLPNPVKDKVGQTITASTDEQIGDLKIGQRITANVKYVGDVPKPGITLYIYNITAVK